MASRSNARYSTVLRRINSVANRVMGTDEFSRGMNSVQSLQLGMQRAFMDAMAAHLNNLNMPSRADVTELGELMRSLDRRVSRVEMLLEQLAGADAEARSRRGPPRTKRPPSESAA